MPLFQPMLLGYFYSNTASVDPCLLICFSEDHNVKLLDHAINFQVSTSECSNGFDCLYLTDLLSETKDFFPLMFPWLSSAGLCISCGEFLWSCVSSQNNLSHCKVFAYEEVMEKISKSETDTDAMSLGGGVKPHMSQDRGWQR